MKYSKKKERIILVAILIVLVIINYGFIDGFLEKRFGEEAILVEVERVIDGDTVVINGTSMRLLGINSPEKGEKYSEEAKEFLEQIVLNKTIVMKSRGKDRYYRELVYLFDLDERKKINLDIVEKGYANFYFPSGKDEYYKDFVDAWDKCLKNNINLCEKSEHECVECIDLEEWGYGKDVILYNTCEKTCDLEEWSIKDQGRKVFVFKDFVLESGEGAQIKAEAFEVEYVWTKSGDSIFIRDENGGLILYKNY
jgi:nuclease-like protein